MKKRISLLIIGTIALSAMLCSCNNNPATKETTAPTETTSIKTGKYMDSTKILTDYANSSVKGKNPIYGTWIIEGYSIPCFIFRNDGLAEMAMGSEGDFTKFTLDTANKKLSASFILGINGSYNYKLSDDEKLLILTNESSTVTLEKQKDYNFIPKAPKNPKVDNTILGWWKSDDGQMYYFGGDGLMYSNQISLETYYTYKINGNKIKATYNYGDDVTVELKYSYSKGVLKINGNKYKPYDVS